jgi:hypothetical protein
MVWATLSSCFKVISVGKLIFVVVSFSQASVQFVSARVRTKLLLFCCGGSVVLQLIRLIKKIVAARKSVFFILLFFII